VNLVSAKPTDQFEAMASVDIGNYGNRRFEGMLNVPIVDDRADLRIAGEWTKRQGYSLNAITDQRIDGRDLWSGRATLSLKPTEKLQAYLVWEHFSESDDRMRTAKQLCKTAQPPTSINGVPMDSPHLNLNGASPVADFVSQGCEATSLYSPDAFQVPYGFSLPYALALGVAAEGNYVNNNLDPYASTTQSRNLRVIESAIDPRYQAKNDTLELNADYAVTPSLTFTSQTGYNQDFLWSTEDYNRFNTSRGIFEESAPVTQPQADGHIIPDPDAGTNGIPANAFLFCDPQLGCSDRLVGEDLSEEHAWQLSQEFRLTSNFGGPLNFSVGGNYLHYETEENYYVFINALTAYAAVGNLGNGTTADNSDCLQGNGNYDKGGYQNPNPISGGGGPTQSCVYIDPNPIGSLNNYGHNYFLSQNPYVLNSYAGFGEAYYNIASDLKLIGGLRWTEDKKRFINIPSEVATSGYGYFVTGTVNQQWAELTGRAAVNWTPKLDFTDQTLVYGSYSRGYKAGGANPPGAVFQLHGSGDIPFPIHPVTFRPEFVNAYELGSKNTLLDGALTLNGDVFYYDYKDYQISEIVDRTSINLNFNATVKGAELETSWEPAPGLKFNFAGGYEDTRIANGQSSIDLMDRTAGVPGWMVYKPFPTQASNCILPTYLVQADLELNTSGLYVDPRDNCGNAYVKHVDPVTQNPYAPNPTFGGGGNLGMPYPIPSDYPGFDPLSVDPNAPANVNGGLGLPPNNGEGFAKNVGGNRLPNAPPFTVSFGAQYTLPITQDWAGTLRGDYYWQDYSWARVFNDNPYDRLRGYTNVNLTLIFTNQNGWQVMLYDKNVFNVTAITGDFLNSDDSGLTTNVFLTDPKLIGIRVTKNW
jgi:iron complex outermembrane recepter protein